MQIPLIGKWLDYFIELNEEHFRLRDEILLLAKIACDKQISVNPDLLISTLEQSAKRINRIMEKHK